MNLFNIVSLSSIFPQFKDLVFLAGIFSEVGNIVTGLFLLIDSVIYGFIGKVYGLFLDIAQARIFSEKVFTDITDKLYAIIGVVMLFVLAYSLLKAIVNPDEMTKGDSSVGKLVSNVVISLILIALVPSIFNFMYRLQGAVLEENVIGHIFFGGANLSAGDTVEVELTYEENGAEGKKTVPIDKKEYERMEKAKAGNLMAMLVLNAFLNPENIDIKGDASKYFNVPAWSWWGCAGGVVITGAVVIGGAIAAIPTGGMSLAAVGGAIGTFGAGSALLGCGGGLVLGYTAGSIGRTLTAKEWYWLDARQYVVETGDFGSLTAYTDNIVNGGDDAMEYMPIVSTAAGIFLLYIMISFCLDLGIRAAKLAFFQLIAPIPIMSRIMPGQKKIFDNWTKKTLSTYMEVFIRVITMFTIMYFISNIDQVFIGGNVFLKMVIVMGIVAFGRQLPKLIGDVFGIDSGSIKLGIGEKLAAGGAFIAGGAIGTGLSGLARNTIGGGAKAVNKWKAGDVKGGFQAFGKGLTSGIAGGIGGLARGGKGNISAKNIADMKKNTSEAIAKQKQAQINRESYKAFHGNVLKGKASDFLSGAKSFGGLETLQAEASYFNEHIGLSKQFKDLYESSDDYLGWKQGYNKFKFESPDLYNTMLSRYSEDDWKDSSVVNISSLTDPDEIRFATLMQQEKSIIDNELMKKQGKAIGILKRMEVLEKINANYDTSITSNSGMPFTRVSGIDANTTLADVQALQKTVADNDKAVKTAMGAIEKNPKYINDQLMKELQDKNKTK